LAKRRRKSIKKEMRMQIKAVLLFALAAFALIGLFIPGQTGGIGIFLNNLLRSLAGDAAFIIPLFIAILAIRTFLPQNRIRLKNRLIGLLIMPFLYITWIHLQLITEKLPDITGLFGFRESIMAGLAREGGGLLGALTATSLYLAIGPLGSLILIYALVVISLLLLFDISLKKIVNTLLKICESLYKAFRKTSRLFINGIKWCGRSINKGVTNMAANRAEAMKVREHALAEIALSTGEQPDQISAAETEPVHDTAEDQDKLLQKSLPEVMETISPETAGEEREELLVTVRSKSVRPEYKFPPLDLLTMPSGGEEQQAKNSRERAKLLENTLLSFGVKAKVIHVQSGPTVTRFEVQPEAGVKVSRISSLSDDLALNLAAPLVRIEAPIPGKAALGIEVPNQTISLVNLREVMTDRAFKMSLSPLTIALGKDITGIAVIADLTKMPHLLIAGATGAGKSVCLNTIITSILYKAGPEQVRFMMIDPKVVELSIYNGIPHLLMPVVTDPRKASLALRNMVREMGRRYDLFARLGVRDIGAYNELTTEDEELELLSYIVVIIDELADLMLVSPGEVEDSIARLAQMSRAAGIHLLVATQRPSVDVLTGIIKANITSRIAFTVSSQFDSRTILDMGGAEKLLGRGDMLFYPVGAVKPFRVQGGYISEIEVKKVTDFIKEQGNADYVEGDTFLEKIDEPEAEEADALFAEAVDLVVRTGQASISLLQRRFRIGYTRAARLIDDLERRGVVGQFEGSKPREVLVTQEQAALICEEFEKRKE